MCRLTWWNEKAEEVRVEAVKSPAAEQRVLLRNVSWETYERLVAEREERRAPRFFYDRGVLEIVSPSAEHEELGHFLVLVVYELVVEWEIDMRAAGHTTFRREDLERGFEPDGSFYFSRNAERVRGKANIDLARGDPPPDLIVEVDVTSHSLDKLPIYARIGVPEVWRYAGGRPEILGLRGEAGGEGYEPLPESRVLPPLTNDVLARFVEGGRTKEPATWARAVREWARRSLGEDRP